MSPPQSEDKPKPTTSLVVGWFRNDLRLSDNPMLEAVLKQAEEGSLPSMLVYIFDPRFYDASPYGRVTNQAKPGKSAMLRGDGFVSRKCNGRRARFYLNVIRNLQNDLAELGTELFIFYGKPEDVFADLSNQYGSLDVVCLREPVSPEWTDVEKYVSQTVEKSGGSLTTLWGAMSLYHEDDLSFKFKEAPKSYSALAWELGWKDVWTSVDQYKWCTPIQKPIPKPTAWATDKVAPPGSAWTAELLNSDRDAMTCLGYSDDEIDATLKVAHGGSRKGKGGEAAAWTRFNAWMAIEAKEETVDPNFKCLGGEYGAAGAKFIKDGEVDPFQWKNLSTSAGWMQLSKYMACGCISAREMYHTLLEKEHWALPGVVHRFMWREWHRINAIKYGIKLFRLTGPGGQYQFPRCGTSKAAQSWKDGQTGVPYIDACMRELNQTGWLPYHKRKTVACFLCHDLMVDWRLGGFHFEEVLLDYDVAMNYGNWTFCARVDKPYNDRYAANGWRDPAHSSVLKSINVNASNDPTGSYIKQWVPELRDVPADWINFPWLMSKEQKEKAQCVTGKDYPEPIVNFSEDELSNWGVVSANPPKKAVPGTDLMLKIASLPGMTTLERFGKFPGVGMCFLLIVHFSGLINNPNNIAKQLCIVCSHNIAIGYFFDRDPEGIYVGFPHFGPLSVDIPVLRILARFWSYEMVAIRFATALRPFFLPGLFASFMSLIIPQAAVFAPWQLGGIVATDYFKNPISFASVNGFPALIWLIWFLGNGLYAMPAKSLADLSTMWVDSQSGVWPIKAADRKFDLIGIALFIFPFVCTFVCKMVSKTPVSKFSAGGKTFFGLHALFFPLYLYLFYAGWSICTVSMVAYAGASFMPIWWVNCLGGIDLWIEQPLGMPAREIAFTPTWIVSHGVFFLQWALDPEDYINRLVFLTYMCPQMVYLNFYFRKACNQDWGTQLPIYTSYFMHWWITFWELYQWYGDVNTVGVEEIYRVVMKDCPLHFTPVQLSVFIIVLSLVFLSPNAHCRWALYSLCGPLNWLGIM